VTSYLTQNIWNSAGRVFIARGRHEVDWTGVDMSTPDFATDWCKSGILQGGGR